MLSKILLSLRFPPYCAFYKDESVAGDLSHCPSWHSETLAISDTGRGPVRTINAVFSIMLPFLSKILRLCVSSDPGKDPLVQECFEHLSLTSLLCSPPIQHNSNSLHIAVLQSKIQWDTADDRDSFVPRLSHCLSPAQSSTGGRLLPSQWNIFTLQSRYRDDTLCQALRQGPRRAMYLSMKFQSVPRFWILSPLERDSEFICGLVIPAGEASCWICCPESTGFVSSW